MKNRLGRLIREGRAPLALIALVLATALVVKLRGTAPRPTPEVIPEMTPSPPDSNAQASGHIARIIEAQAATLMAIPGVHGVAEGRTPDGRPCILLLVQNLDAPGLPREIEGIPVRLDQSEEIRGLGEGVGQVK
jgi:hypothetical protein